jgi:hypothetical protein
MNSRNISTYLADHSETATAAFVITSVEVDTSEIRTLVLDLDYHRKSLGYVLNPGARERDSLFRQTAGLDKLLRQNASQRRLLLQLFCWVVIDFVSFLFLWVPPHMLLRRLACSSSRRNNCFASVSLANNFLRTGTLVERTSSGTAAGLGNTFTRRLTASSQSRSDNMGVDDAFAEMEAAGVPKKGQPTAAAAPEQEQQKDLPKLSAAEFRVYNRMAEHMDMFVSNRKSDTYIRSPITKLTLFPSHSTTISAKPGTSSTAPAPPAKNPKA